MKTDLLIENIKKLGYEILNESYKGTEEYNKDEITSRYWQLPNENYKLKNTQFFHDSENDFIHFTSIEALYSIINHGHIRLYNLVNMDDKFELEYASKELLFRNSNKNDKEQLFCFSMCSSNKILKSEINEHLLWKLHGRNGNGVIIRFNIENNLDLWYNFHLTKMFYDLKNFELIRELNTKEKKEFLDAKLACFIKLPIYEFENEIRLVFDNRNPVTVTNKDNEILFPIIYPDNLLKSNNVSYFQLPLLNFHETQKNIIFKAPNIQKRDYEIPKLKIVEIILGYRYSNTELENIQSKVSSKLGDINIKISELRKYY